MRQLAFFGLFLAFSSIGYAKQPSIDKARAQYEPLTKAKHVEPKVVPLCKKVTDVCSVCSDCNLRDPASNKVIQISPYACASKESAKAKFKFKNVEKMLLALKDCKAVSDHCAVCSDGRYAFTQDGTSINTSFYECANTPALRGVASVK